MRDPWQLTPALPALGWLLPVPACAPIFWFFTLLMWSSTFLCVLADLFLSILYSFCSWVTPSPPFLNDV